MNTFVITILSLLGVAMAMFPGQQTQQTGGPIVDVTGVQTLGGQATGGQTGWTQNSGTGFQTPYDAYNTMRQYQSYNQQQQQQQTQQQTQQNTGMNPLMWMMLRNIDNPWMRFMVMSGQQGTAGINPFLMMRMFN